MLTRTTLLGAVCAAALTAIPFTSAMAAAPMGFAGTFSGHYSHADYSGATTNGWGGSAAAAFGFNPRFRGQVDGGYHRLSGSGVDVDAWNVAGGTGSGAPVT